MLSHRNCPPINSNPNDWDCAELASWIRKAGYDEVAKTLFDEVWLHFDSIV